MEITKTTERQAQDSRPAATSSQQRASQDYARQVSVDDAKRHEQRAANNRDVARRQARSAFQESVEQERLMQRDSMEAGVEKMVRSVVRKESAQQARQSEQQVAQELDSSEQARLARERLDAVYNGADSGAVRERESQSQPSNRQQQRAIENYQQSTRNSVDRTVELVI